MSQTAEILAMRERIVKEIVVHIHRQAATTLFLDSAFETITAAIDTAVRQTQFEMTELLQKADADRARVRASQRKRYG